MSPTQGDDSGHTLPAPPLPDDADVVGAGAVVVLGTAATYAGVVDVGATYAGVVGVTGSGAGAATGATIELELCTGAT